MSDILSKEQESLRDLRKAIKTKYNIEFSSIKERIDWLDANHKDRSMYSIKSKRDRYEIINLLQDAVTHFNDGVKAKLASAKTFHFAETMRLVEEAFKILSQAKDIA